jgi:transcriptional regulator with XRE-family HTH domain
MATENSFGRWVKQRRKELDLTQEALARQVGCSVSTLKKIEAAVMRPSRQLVDLLLTRLQVASHERLLLMRWARAAQAHESAGALAETQSEPDRGFEHADIGLASSPYIVGPPISHPRQFFGRSFEVQQIFARWRRLPLQHVAIIGPRRSGKTSLLSYLMTITRMAQAALRPMLRGDWLAHPEHYHWIFVDFQDARMRRRERLLRHILAGLQAPQPEVCDLETFLDLMSRHVRGPTVLLLDELESGMATPELDVTFWESLRSLACHATQGRLGFAVAAHDDPAALARVQSQSSPFFNIFGYTFPLGPLTEAEALEFLASAPMPLDPSDRAWILERSGRWPCLLQILCDTWLLTLEGALTVAGWRQEAQRRCAPYQYLLDRADAW